MLVVVVLPRVALVMMKETNMATQSELDAVKCGQGIIKNDRYFNTGKTYNADGTLRMDFDVSNANNPWFNGDTMVQW